jgi:predicted transposase YbfD/YdcC
MFVEEGIFHAGPGEPLVGREAIEAFYAWRRERGRRTSRHIVTNFHAVFDGERKARTTCIMILYGTDGEPPHKGTGAAMIADMVDECIKGEDGVWRYARRDFVPLYMGEAELTVAPALLARIDWHGRVLTGDALFCQRALCRQGRDAGGDYLVLVKENQGTLYRDIRLLFDPPAEVAALPLADRRVARTVETGHGRAMEVRELVASTDLGGYLTWPGHAQVFRLERTWREHGRRRRARHYGITSLPPGEADPARLLALKRGHWAIENRLHRRKDVTLGEDASLIHAGQGPTVMALLRDAAVSVLHRAGIRRVAARLRRHSQHPAEAVALVVGPLPAHA